MSESDVPAKNPSEQPASAPRPLIMRLLGIRRRPGKRLPIAPNKWGWFLLLLVIMGVGGAAFAEYSMQPSFCNSCHIMKPYFEAWHQSTHAKVPCVDCHFDPGLKNTLMGKWQASSQAVKYITQTYGSKPHAEVHDAACMRSGCHETRLLEGKVKWPVKNARGDTVTINFDHAPHLNQERRGRQLRCVSCHSQIVQGKHITVTVDACYLCHFKGLQHGRTEQTIGGCTGCHNAPKEQIKLATGMFAHSEYLNRGVTCENCHSDTIKGEGDVPRQVCWNCHNQTTQVARYGEDQFIHKTHVSDHKVECSSCHVVIEHRLDAAADSLFVSGASGHVRSEGTSCAQCHESMHGGPVEGDVVREVVEGERREEAEARRAGESDGAEDAPGHGLRDLEVTDAAREVHRPDGEMDGAEMHAVPQRRGEEDEALPEHALREEPAELRGLAQVGVPQRLGVPDGEPAAAEERHQHAQDDGHGLSRAACCTPPATTPLRLGSPVTPVTA